MTDFKHLRLPVLCLAAALVCTLCACTGAGAGKTGVSSVLSAASPAAGGSAPSAVSAASVSSSVPASSLTSAASSRTASAASAQAAGIEKMRETAFNEYSARQYDAAEKECDAVLALVPNDVFAHTLKGAALCFQGDYANGMPLLRRALELGPNDFYARFNMAMGCKLQKDYDDALTWFNRALQVKPNDAWTYYGIATIYADRNETAQAMQNLQKAVSLDTSVKAVAKEQDHFRKYHANADFIRITG